MAERAPEPWLRGTLHDVPPVPRAVLHALELAREDLQHWCAGLSDEEVHARPSGLPSVAFHLRHIAGSLDRLLTYAEGRDLDSAQMAALLTETVEAGASGDLLQACTQALTAASPRIRALAAAAPSLEAARTVGRKRLPTTVGGLLVHIADHTRRHVGQAITTARVLLAAREP
jgi:uncharacterized damage-inducible protein DinB